MTQFDDLDRALAAFFESEAIASDPDGLLELVTGTTATRRPRPAWRARLDDWSAPTAIAARPMARLILIGIVLLLAFAAAVLVAGRRTDQARPVLGIWTPTGALQTPLGSSAHAAVLADGRVAMTGGTTDQNIQFFDPATGRFSPGAAAIPLTESVLVAQPDGSLLAFGDSVQRQSGPDVGAITVLRVDGGSGRPGAVLGRSPAFRADGFFPLADGRILIVGERCAGQPCDSTLGVVTYVMDQTFRFSPGPETSSVASIDRVVALSDGRFLIIEMGSDEKPSQAMVIFDPDRGTFTAAGTMTPRADFSATTLRGGRVLIAGGFSYPQQQVLDTALIVDASGAEPSVTETNRMPVGGWVHQAALLPDGRVLLLGGDLAPAAPFGPTATTAYFDPATGRFDVGPPMTTPRIRPLIVTLADGRILAIGHLGLAANSQPTGAELTAEVFR